MSYHAEVGILAAIPNIASFEPRDVHRRVLLLNRHATQRRMSVVQHTDRETQRHLSLLLAGFHLNTM